MTVREHPVTDYRSLMGGHVQMMIDAITTTAPTVQEGQVRVV